MNNFNQDNAEIGSRIREIRLKRHMTQETLAEKANICNPQQMSNIERGLAGFSVARLKDLCKVLEIESDYLLFGISANNAETQLHKYIEKMNTTQVENLLDLIRLYIRICGIDDN